MSTSPTETTTTLQALAASIATPEGCAALLQRAFNGDGQKYITRKGLVRAHRAEISYMGVPMVVEYTLNDCWMSATEIDAGEQPYVEALRSVQIGGVECLRMLTEEQREGVTERVERSWAREGV
jgi:hypothetical protein